MFLAIHIERVRKRDAKRRSGLAHTPTLAGLSYCITQAKPDGNAYTALFSVYFTQLTMPAGGGKENSMEYKALAPGYSHSGRRQRIL